VCTATVMSAAYSAVKSGKKLHDVGLAAACLAAIVTFCTSLDLIKVCVSFVINDTLLQSIQPALVPTVRSGVQARRDDSIIRSHDARKAQHRNLPWCHRSLAGRALYAYQLCTMCRHEERSLEAGYVTRRSLEATGTRNKNVGAAYAAAHDPTVPTSHLVNLDKDASQAKQFHVRSAALRIAAAIIYAMSPAGRWKCLLAVSAVLVVAVMACWGHAAVRRCDRAQAGHVCHMLPGLDAGSLARCCKQHSRRFYWVTACADVRVTMPSQCNSNHTDGYPRLHLQAWLGTRQAARNFAL